MDPNAGTGFASVQGSAVMHNSGVAMDGSYDTSFMSHQYNAVPMDSSGMQTQDGMLVHYSNGTPVNADSAVDYTPVTRRKSRAKKGKPVHFCDACEPRRVSLQLNTLVHLLVSNSSLRPLHERNTCG